MTNEDFSKVLKAINSLTTDVFKNQILLFAILGALHELNPSLTCSYPTAFSVLI